MVDIFSQGSEVRGTYAEWKEVGDNYQGTFVGKRKAIDSYGNDQIIYEIKREDGSIIMVAVRTTKEPFHNQMRHVNLGQIIGVKFTGTIPSEKGNDTKILSVFADAKIVDEDWMKNRDEQVMGESEEEVAPAPVATPTTGQPATVAPPATNQAEVGGEEIKFDKPPFEDTAEEKEAKLKAIADLAKTKLGVEDINLIKDKVMEATGVPFLPDNLDAIIAKLEALPAK